MKNLPQVDLVGANARLESECSALREALAARGQYIAEPSLDGKNVVESNAALVAHKAVLMQKLNSPVQGQPNPVHAGNAQQPAPKATGIAKDKWAAVEQSRALTPDEKLLRHEGVSNLEELKTKRAAQRNAANRKSIQD